MLHIILYTLRDQQIFRRVGMYVLNTEIVLEYGTSFLNQVMWMCYQFDIHLWTLFLSFQYNYTIQKMWFLYMIQPKKYRTKTINKIKKRKTTLFWFKLDDILSKPNSLIFRRQINNFFPQKT